MKTMKTLMLATVAALSIGTGAAMAQKGDAQNLYNGSPRVFNDIASGTYFTTGPGAYAANSATPRLGAQTSRTAPMFGQLHVLPWAPDRSAGGGH